MLDFIGENVMGIRWAKRSTCICIIMQIMLAIMILSVAISSVCAQGNNGHKVTIEYFYMNACDACPAEEEFLEELNRILGKMKDGVETEVLTYNTFHISGAKKFEEYKKSYNIPEYKLKYDEFIFINGTYLAGREEINKNLAEEFLKAKTSAEKYSEGDTGNDSKSFLKSSDSDKSTTLKNNSLMPGTWAKSTIVYFYVAPCASCEEVERFFSTLEKEYFIDTINGKRKSELLIKKYNISSGRNLELIREYFSAYMVPESEQKVPIVFIGDIYLQGEKEIQGKLLESVKAGYGLSTLLVEDNEIKTSLAHDTMENYQALGIFLTGLINGFNPCSISMLLFFLSMIIVKNRNVLNLGISFISGKFTAYFLLGTLFYSIFEKINGKGLYKFNAVLKAVLLIISIFLILLNIRDYFAVKNERYDKVRVQLPAILRKLNHKWIKKVTAQENIKLLIILSFLLGIIISVGEFLCTGQIYLATIVYVLRTSDVFNVKAALYFLLYSLALIAPLTVFTFVIHKGREIMDVTELVRGKMHIIKLVNAAFFLVFALLILLLF